MPSETFALTNKTRSKVPRFAYEKIKEKVLGKKYSLSLVFVTPKESLSLNRTYRKKRKPANVLAFPLSPRVGEIYIDITTATREAKKFDTTPARFVLWLFIHALLHLKGHHHGVRMDVKERRFRMYLGLF